jgi:hypothetical protein
MRTIYPPVHDIDSDDYDPSARPGYDRGIDQIVVTSREYLPDPGGSLRKLYDSAPPHGGHRASHLPQTTKLKHWAS